MSKEKIDLGDCYIDLTTGDLTHDNYGTLKLNMWRAKTDNDRGLGNFDKRLKFLIDNRWEKATKNYKLRKFLRIGSLSNNI